MKNPELHVTNTSFFVKKRFLQCLACTCKHTYVCTYEVLFMRTFYTYVKDGLRKTHMRLNHSLIVIDLLISIGIRSQIKTVL
jgi:hypothetical protein